jgi:hypothetical protein
MQTGSPFGHSIFTVQTRCVQMILGRCEVLDASGNRILWAKLVSASGPKIRVYAGKSRSNEILRVDRPMAFGAMSEIYDYSVFDYVGDVRIATWRSQGDSWKLKPSEKISAPLLDRMQADDVWKLLGESHQELGYFKRVRELESLFQPTVTVRRGESTLKFRGIPREGWDGYVDDDHLCQIVRWDSITPRITVDCSPDTEAKLDRRLPLSIAFIQMAIEVDRQTNTGW